MPKSEKVNRNIIRKSIYANSVIKKNEIFTTQNIKLKRPGTGISPNYMKKFWERNQKEILDLIN